MNASPLEATVSGDGGRARIALRGRIDREGDVALAEASSRRPRSAPRSSSSTSPRSTTSTAPASR